MIINILMIGVIHPTQNSVLDNYTVCHEQIVIEGQREHWKDKLLISQSSGWTPTPVTGITIRALDSSATHTGHNNS